MHLLYIRIFLLMHMSPTPEELLEEARRLHQSADYKKGLKTAEKALKRFQKQMRLDRAIEALRVMGDCAINAHDLKKAAKLYESLMDEGVKISNLWYQSAAHWGLGQVLLRTLQYEPAANHFMAGLDIARKISDKWYTAWNAFGLANALRGMGRLEDARSLLQEALESFRAQNQNTFADWVEKALADIGADVPSPGELRVWLCPLCGSKFTADQVTSLKSGTTATCEYCGTATG
ncbi:MAG: tetratricopeptide repeat protein [Candidatus Thorarchaeota archaeon]|nr:MAG: hypothetical protein DRP09_05025 [Candidatus Thorarchaeota archaeon]